MKITVLGSGTAAPRLRRNMSGYLLEAGAKKILFDSGAGTIRQLLKLKINLLDIGNIFYTHLHNDHINDLPAIIWSNNYGTFRKKPLNIYGPAGFKEYCKTLMGKILRPEKLIYRINVREMENGSVVKIQINRKNHEKNKEGITVKSIKSKHILGRSVSYRIEYDNKSIVYSGDTDYSKEIIEISKNADLLILECSFPCKKKGHLTPSLCGAIAAKAKAKKLVLTHFYPECDAIDVKKECSKEYRGKIILARDLMKVEA
ncbi:ribonuclease Z [Candidatus Woesearchaeota archaeon]|nr:ribonuclease Z [Candidatus Woesearchaeota archaeon]